jgi:two-component sensor histidine kinase
VSTKPFRGRFLSRFDGARFNAVKPNLPPEVADPSWAPGQQFLQDRAGEWWVSMLQGLARYPASADLESLSRASPIAIYTSANGLPAGEVLHVYEDRRGDLWISTFSEERNGITKWSRKESRFHTFGVDDGLPGDLPIVSAFAEDSTGALWAGCEGQRLACFRAGRFKLYGADDGVPGRDITALHLDSKGRLWIGTTSSGAWLLENPERTPLHFSEFSTSRGLSSTFVSCFAEDRWGRIYMGTGRGVDQLDPDSGMVRHFTEAEGLAGGSILAAFHDRKGVLWFGTSLGLSRLVPQVEALPRPLSILISGLRIANRPWPVPALGTPSIKRLQLSHEENNLSIDFVCPSYRAGEELRFQYELEGADSEWSPPTTDRTVHYASLKPGTYRFKVRAITSAGVTHQEPAELMFVILPPMWLRAWFLGTSAFLLGGFAYWLYRWRVARLLELQAIRMRIATDLHDDIGANLTQIAILSEVVSRQVEKSSPDALSPLSLIAGTARELVDSMSDIVWSINPDRDHLHDLSRRMRQFANNLLTGRNITVVFELPEDGRNISIGSDLRRQVYLIFKEALHNVVRHSGCSKTRITLELNSGHLSLSVADNGGGLPDGGMGDGHGIASMRNRAARLGGILELNSVPGAGTTLELRIPVERGMSRDPKQFPT